MIYPLFLLLTAWHADAVFAQDYGNDPNNVTLCGQSDFYNSTSEPYSFNNNMWGDDGSGYSCTDVLDQGNAFTVKYKWTGDASTVKGFPYMKLSPSRLPVQLWNVSTLHFSGEWSTIVDGTESQSPEEQAQAYNDIGLKVNVAMDMFLSDNITNSTEVGSPIEIMIWLWHVPAILPLGHAESTPDVDTVTVDGVDFSLYHGYNAQGQHVFSWLSQRNITSTDADYSPLLKYIWDEGLLSGALFLGQLEFGTEVMHAGLPTTFTASDYDLMLYRQGDSDDPAPTTIKSSSSSNLPTSSSTRIASSTAATSTAAPAATSSGASASGGKQSITADLGMMTSLVALAAIFTFWAK